MAFNYFIVYPTCDIHLLSTGVELVPIQLKVLTNKPKTDITSHPRTQYEGFNDGIVMVEKGKFLPKRGMEGETIGRVIHVEETGTKHEVLVRVRVHKAISDLWIGNSQCTIFANESNYVLSVFAKFSDSTFGDITSHPFLEFKLGLYET